MSTRERVTEMATLERYRVALENVETQSEIATIMAEFGYDAALIENGKQLFTKTRQVYDLNVKEDDETSQAYSNFMSKRNLLEDAYSLHRKKAKVIFRKDLEILKRLALDGTIPRAYVSWLETAKKFYTEVLADTELQTKLSRLKITTEDLNAANTLISELETARAEYMKEKGESQDATKQKDTIFAQLDDWMSEFYAVARIALEDNIQLLEALGVIVRN
ncbi:MAG TPA: hypothetical protein DCG75_10765 [Bacteroidales bacterium]|nr:hypothetical protein [Bacteroidales bacterium]